MLEVEERNKRSASKKVDRFLELIVSENYNFQNSI